MKKVLKAYKKTVSIIDRNRVKNILFEDIRVESIQEGKLFHINIRFNPKYDKQPGQSIDGVTFRNITYNGVGENPSNHFVLIR